MNIHKKHQQKRILSGASGKKKRRIHGKLLSNKVFAIVLSLVMVLSMVPFFGNAVRAAPPPPTDLSTFEPQVILFLSPNNGYSGEETVANVWVDFSALNDDLPGVFYVEVKLPPCASNVYTAAGDSSGKTFATGSDTVTIIFDEVKDDGWSTETGGWGRALSFNLTPCASDVTPDGTELTFTAKLYIADEIDYDETEIYYITNGTEVWSDGIHVTDDATYTVKAAVNWTATAGISYAGGTLPHADEYLTAPVIFTYKPSTNYGSQTVGIEHASKLEYYDEITIPDDILVTRSMVTTNTTVPGSPANITTSAEVEYLDEDGIVIADDATPVKTIKVKYTVVNDDNPTEEIPNGITSTLTISNAYVDAALGPFIFESGTLNGTVTGIVDGAPDEENPSTATFSATRGRLIIARGSAPAEEGKTPQPLPTITKGPASKDLTSKDSPLAAPPNGVDTDITFTLSNFGNALISKEDSGYDAVANDFKIVDFFETYGEVLYLKEITIGQFEKCDGVDLDVKITFYDPYPTEASSPVTLSVNNAELLKGTTLSSSELGLAADKQIKQIEFDFGNVPVGFKIKDEGNISLKFDTPPAATGTISDKTITNNATVSYTGATYTDGTGLGHPYSKVGKSTPYYLERTSPLIQINKTFNNVTTGNNALFSAGDEVEYTLTIKNIDHYAITNLTIEDYASQYLDFTGYFEDGELIFTASDNTGSVTNRFDVTGPEASPSHFTIPSDLVDGDYYKITWKSTTSPQYTLDPNRTLTITYKARIADDVSDNDVENVFFVTAVDWWINNGSGHGVVSGGSGPYIVNGNGMSKFTPTDNVLRAGINKDITEINGELVPPLLANFYYKATDEDIITYELTVKNLSTLAAMQLFDPVVIDVLPTGMKFDSWDGNVIASDSGSVAADLTVSGNKLIWEFEGSLEQDVTWTLVFKAQVDFGVFTTSVPTYMTNNCYLLPFPGQPAGDHLFTYDLGNNNKWGLSYIGDYDEYELVPTHAVRNNYRIDITVNRSAQIEKRAFKTDTAGTGWITDAQAATTGNRVKSGDTVVYQTTFTSTGKDSINVFRFVDNLPLNETFVNGSVEVQIVRSGGSVENVSSATSWNGSILVADFDDQELFANDKIVVTFKTTVNIDAAENTMAGSPKYRGENSSAFYATEFVGNLTGPTSPSNANTSTYRSAIDDTTSDWDGDNMTGVRYQANCFVYYNADLVIPQIEKKAYYISQDIYTGSEKWSPYNNNILRGGDEIGWVITINNLGGSTVDMIFPDVIDLLPKQLTYKADSTYTWNGSAPTTVNLDEPGKGTVNGQTALIWQIEKLTANGGTVTFCFRTTIAAGFVGQLTNHSYLVPQEKFIEWGGSKSTLIDEHSPANDYGAVKLSGSRGVKSSASIMVAGSAAIASVKSVKGTFESVTQTSDPGGYIPVDRESTFTYTLTVINLGSTPRADMVIIDSLPQQGDRGLVADEDRMSGFTVVLAGPITATTGYYSIEYSTEDKNFSNGDWNGDLDDKWLSESAVGDWSEIRSFRVKYTTALGLLDSWTITVTAKAEDGAQPGPIAWNSFGYEFNTSDMGRPRTRLEPLKVGVTVGDAKDGRLEIEKTVTGTTAFSRTFYFDIVGKDYDGNEVYNSKTEGYPNGVPVTVSAGSTTGKSDILTDLPYGKYTVTERAVSGYVASYANNNTEVPNGGDVVTFKVTNTYDPGGDPPGPETPPPTPPTPPPPDGDDDDGEDEEGGETPEIIQPSEYDDGDPDGQDVLVETPEPGGTDISVPPVPTSPGNTLVEDGDGWIELDEDGVPLGRWSYDPDEDMWLFDPFPPLAGALPQTGIGAQAHMLLMLGLYLTGVGVIVKSRERKRKKST